VLPNGLVRVTIVRVVCVIVKWLLFDIVTVVDVIVVVVVVVLDVVAAFVVVLLVVELLFLVWSRYLLSARVVVRICMKGWTSRTNIDAASCVGQAVVLITVHLIRLFFV